MMDREATTGVLTTVFAVAMKLDSEYHEEQMTTGQSFGFWVEAGDGTVQMKYAGIILWDTEGKDIEDLTEEAIERDARKELYEFILTVVAIENTIANKDFESRTKE